MHIPFIRLQLTFIFMAEKVNATGRDEGESNIACKEREMFNRIAQCDVIIKSQQRDDNELTLSEKYEHLSKIYHQNKVSILQRFGNHLNLKDFELFNEPDNYEMQFYVNKYRALQDPVHKEQVVKNRRYNYLKNVLKQSDYFEDKELEKRNPLLYKQYIGQYISDDEIQNSRNNENTFSEFLFNKIDKSINNFRCDIEQHSCDVEEDEEDSDNDIENDEDFKKYLEEKIPMENEERIQLRKEFLCLMENSFLIGDENFDYSVIDNDEQYDNMCDQDIEDHYFDEENSSENEVVIEGTNCLDNYFDGDDDACE